MSRRTKHDHQTRDFIAKAKARHGDRYDYSRVVYADAQRTKVTIVCAEHGEFRQLPSKHLGGQGCPKCGGTAQMDTADFITKARARHGDKYDYRKTVYVVAIQKVAITCPEHRDFEQTPNAHLNGAGCPECGRRASAEAKYLTQDEFLTRAAEVHGDRYDYREAIYKSNHEPVVIRCRKHGQFRQTPDKHMAGQGCVRCTSQVSRPETAWLDSLGITERQKLLKVPGLRHVKVDGFASAANTVYLFHGDYWHGNPEVHSPEAIHPKAEVAFSVLYERTLTRDQAIRNAGYNLVVIWEADWAAQVAQDHHSVEVDGVVYPHLRAAAKAHWVPYPTVYSRLCKLGWTLRQAVGLDPAPRRRRRG